jgi:hypothetical protein
MTADIDLAVICTHDGDGDTPVEEAKVVCQQKAIYIVENSLITAGFTFLATTTGDARAIVTLTNPANLALRTTDAEPIDVSGRHPSRSLPQPTPIAESEDHAIDTGASEPDPTIPGDAPCGARAPRIVELAFLAAISVLAHIS